MKVSELTPAYVGGWLGYAAEDELLTAGQTAELTAALAAAKAFALGFTGLTEEELDDYEDLTIAVIGLCNDYLVSNRPEAAPFSVNKMSEGLLSMHCRNFL